MTKRIEKKEGTIRKWTKKFRNQKVQFKRINYQYEMSLLVSPLELSRLYKRQRESILFEEPIVTSPIVLTTCHDYTGLNEGEVRILQAVPQFEAKEKALLHAYETTPNEDTFSDYMETATFRMSLFAAELEILKQLDNKEEIVFTPDIIFGDTSVIGPAEPELYVPDTLPPTTPKRKKRKREVPPPPKKRGRPSGSKNKPKKQYKKRKLVLK